jgi:Bacterial transcriptional activator domain
MKRALRIIALMAVAGGAVISLSVFVARRQGSAPAAKPGVTLLVNRQPRVHIAPGTPLLFELSVSSSPTLTVSSVGSRLRPWHDLLVLEVVGATATPWPVVRIGTPRSVHVAREANGRHRVTPEVSPVARLDGGQYVHTVTFASGPEQTATMAPGTYRFRGVLQTPSWLVWGGWTGRVVSGIATVIVDAGRQPELEANRFASTAAFYLNAARFEDARRAATELINVNPKDARAHTLLGDALAALGRRREALAAYQHALAVLPQSYETPTLLMERIRSMKEPPK